MQSIRTTNRPVTFAGVFVLLALIATVLVASSAEATGRWNRSDDAVAVANRGSGDLSVINTSTLAVRTIDLPGEAEPMYVNHDRRNDYVYVGDRASSQLLVLDDADYSLVESIPVGDGVFHQWYDARSRQLWVVGDVAQTVSVIDSDKLAVEATIDIPAELVAQGARPHDVFVKGRRAFVSLLGFEDGSGMVLQYSTRTFEETGRIITGGDPHLFVTGNRLYVASQDGSTVSLYNARTLRLRNTIDIPSAHGIFVAGRDVYVTNITGGGIEAVFELTRRLNRVTDVASTPFPVPHNLTVDRNQQIWVTHSGGSANQVSVIDRNGKRFGQLETVEVGTNPFGLGFVRG